MARDHARIQLSIWRDEGFRALTPPAQHLYLALLTSPDPSYCGVADWRPARIADRSRTWSTTGILTAAVELSAARFIVADDGTEEVLLRTFVRHDGLMKDARMAVSMVKAFDALASNTLRGVVVHELRRLHDAEPDLRGWTTTAGKPGRALDLLTLTPVDPTALPPYLPIDLPPALGVALGVALDQTPTNVRGSVRESPTPFSSLPSPSSTPPSPIGEAPQEQTTRKRGSRISENFTPSKELQAFAAERGLSEHRTAEITAEFVDYWRGVSGSKGTKVDWDGTWRNWVRRQTPNADGAAKRSPTELAGLTPRARAEAEGREYKPWEDY